MTDGEGEAAAAVLVFRRTALVFLSHVHVDHL